MDNLEYLNRISAESKTGAVNAGTEPLFSGKMKKFLIAAAAFLVIIIIVGIILSSSKPQTTDLSQLKLRADNINTNISLYQPSVKSTSLRASSTSLKAILSSFSASITPLISTEPSADVTTYEESIMTDSADVLEHAKLTGTLDRVYPTEISYQIKLLLPLLEDGANATSDSSAQSVIVDTYNSLTTLLPSFASE